jgi:hypothetical protein
MFSMPVRDLSTLRLHLNRGLMYFKPRTNFRLNFVRDLGTKECQIKTPTRLGSQKRHPPYTNDPSSLESKGPRMQL